MFSSRLAENSIMKKPGRLIPPVYLLLTLAASVTLHYTVPFAYLLQGVFPRVIGFALIVVGVATSAAGAAAFKKAGTAVRPFEPAAVLVRAGLYRYSRNPMYVGLLLVTIGAATVLGTASAFVPPVVFFFILRSQFVLPEEEFLHRAFGDAYSTYTQQVRRWL
jgi:protein-S-isoprenylcysteine O-methyltransferase Ste14